MVAGAWSLVSDILGDFALQLGQFRREDVSQSEDVFFTWFPPLIARPGCLLVVFHILDANVTAVRPALAGTFTSRLLAFPLDSSLSGFLGVDLQAWKNFGYNSEPNSPCPFADKERHPDVDIPPVGIRTEEGQEGSHRVAGTGLLYVGVSLVGIPVASRVVELWTVARESRTFPSTRLGGEELDLCFYVWIGIHCL